MEKWIKCRLKTWKEIKATVPNHNRYNSVYSNWGRSGFYYEDSVNIKDDLVRFKFNLSDQATFQEKELIFFLDKKRENKI